jgi:predicted DNA-binding transcriptional regulator AlpA
MKPLLEEEAAAPLIGWSVSTLQKKRVAGDGPPFVKLGRSVRYRPEDLEAYVAARVVSSTSELRAA